MKKTLAILFLAAHSTLAVELIQIPLSLSNTNPFVWTNAFWWTNSPAQTNIVTWQAWYSINENFNRVSNTLRGYAVTATNPYNPVVLDATLPQQAISTNQSFTISGFSGLVSGSQHGFGVKYLNTAASNIVVTGPPTCFYAGSVSTNSQSIPAGKRGYWTFLIEPNVETNAVNCLQQ